MKAGPVQRHGASIPKKVTDLFSIQLMPKINQTLFPTGFFGTDAVVAYPQRILFLVQQSGLRHGRLLAPLAFPFRLPFLRLTGCFWRINGVSVD